MIIEILIAWVYGHIMEYFLHRHILHNKLFSPFFKIHFSEHHKNSRKFKMIDARYLTWFGTIFHFETYSLVLLAVLHFPVFLYFPFAYGVIVFNILTYFYIHRKAHLNSWWARENLEWHYDHHMGKNQNKNWGIRSSLVDEILKTREHYKESHSEYEKHQKEIKKSFSNISSYKDKG